MKRIILILIVGMFLINFVSAIPLTDLQKEIKLFWEERGVDSVTSESIARGNENIEPVIRTEINETTNKTIIEVVEPEPTSEVKKKSNALGLFFAGIFLFLMFGVFYILWWNIKGVRGSWD